jgi:polysaccharide export outer membrane protein
LAIFGALPPNGAAQANPAAPSPAVGQEFAGVGSVNQSATPTDFQQRYPRYQLHIGDVVEIVFPLTPDFSQVVKVEPDGYIPLHGAHNLHVAGQTVPEVIESIRKAYREILRDPEITLSLKEFEKPYFMVSGQVARAGKYDLTSDTTVTQGLALAGGLTKDAKHSNVVLFRRAADGSVEVKKLDVKHMLNSANLTEDVSLRPGDMLYVPKNSISKIQGFLPSTSMGVYK